MGYIGLLLNAPDRDRIDGCMLDIFRFLSFVICCVLVYWWLYEPGRQD
jgi:hypothetical protein